MPNKDNNKTMIFSISTRENAGVMHFIAVERLEKKYVGHICCVCGDLMLKAPMKKIKIVGGSDPYFVWVCDLCDEKIKKADFYMVDADKGTEEKIQ
jgi:hypothetical protein